MSFLFKNRVCCNLKICIQSYCNRNGRVHGRWKRILHPSTYKVRDKIVAFCRKVFVFETAGPPPKKLAAHVYNPIQSKVIKKFSSTRRYIKGGDFGFVQKGMMAALLSSIISIRADNKKKVPKNMHKPHFSPPLSAGSYRLHIS